MADAKPETAKTEPEPDECDPADYVPAERLKRQAESSRLKTLVSFVFQMGPEAMGPRGFAVEATEAMQPTFKLSVHAARDAALCAAFRAIQRISDQSFPEPKEGPDADHD